MTTDIKFEAAIAALQGWVGRERVVEDEIGLTAARAVSQGCWMWIRPRLRRGWNCRRIGPTRLYKLIETHYPAFVEHLAARGPLPAHGQREFEVYLKGGRLEHGFLQVRCALS